MRVLQIGSDRSKRGVLFPDTPASNRQRAYAEELGEIDIIACSLTTDGAAPYHAETLSVYPTHSPSRLLYAYDAWHIFRNLAQPDVISVQDPFEIGMLGLFFSHIAGVPLHVQIHTDYLSPGFAKHSLLNRLRIWMADFVVPRARGIRTVSGQFTDNIRKRYVHTAQIAVLPIFADIEGIQKAVPSLELVQKYQRFDMKMLFVGRLEPEKNPCLAIDAFAASAPHNSCLIVVGDGSERSHLEDRARTKGVAHRVFFEGTRDAAPYYHIADLVLVTSRYEGYGLVIIEALTAGKPVLSTDVGIAKEAGAIIAKDFIASLRTWLEHGPRIGELKNYPYKNESEYVRAYGDNLRSCIQA